MKFELRQILSTRQQLNICIGVLVISLLGSAMGEQSFDGPESDVSKVNVDSSDMDSNFWAYYFLSHLERALQRQISRLKEGQRLSQENDDASYLQSGREKRKVLGVAGLDNFDVMTKTLDRTRNRFPMMMSVPRMNTNRLRMLMESQGRRK